jgi:predicted DCC family thiol-disulfide oxidoreductase YuxK
MPVLVFYDAECRLCAWLMLVLLRWDRRRCLRPAPIQGREAERVLARMSPEERLRSWHACAACGGVSSGGAALPLVLRRLPGGGPLAAASERLPGATERAYAWVAEHRAQLVHALPRRTAELAPVRLARVCAERGTL